LEYTIEITRSGKKKHYSFFEGVDLGGLLAGAWSCFNIYIVAMSLLFLERILKWIFDSLNGHKVQRISSPTGNTKDHKSFDENKTKQNDKDTDRNVANIKGNETGNEQNKLNNQPENDRDKAGTTSDIDKDEDLLKPYCKQLEKESNLKPKHSAVCNATGSSHQDSSHIKTQVELKFQDIDVDGHLVESFCSKTSRERSVIKPEQLLICKDFSKRTFSGQVGELTQSSSIQDKLKNILNKQQNNPKLKKINPNNNKTSAENPKDNKGTKSPKETYDENLTSWLLYDER